MLITENNEDSPEEKQPATLRERLVAGYLTNAQSDAILAEEWRPIEEEVWKKLPFWIP